MFRDNVNTFLLFLSAVTRIMGNHKGLLTRQRQPKMGAYIIRARYWSMINNTMFLSTNHSAEQQSCDFQQHGTDFYMLGNNNVDYKLSPKVTLYSP